jgi:hypothetical protein
MELIDDLCSCSHHYQLSHIRSDSVFFFVDYFCFIPLYSMQSIRGVHKIQWDKAEVIHKEENRITTELKELVLITIADNHANA